MTHAELRDRLRLSRTGGVGPVTYRRLMRRFTHAAEAIDALPGIAAAAGRGQPPTTPSIQDAEREMEQVAALGGRMLALDGPGYPLMLALLDVSPPILTVLGDPAALAVRAVALVGARNASAHGQRMAELLAADLAKHDLMIVSGMARGIDAAAHDGAMRTGRTVAVIATGIDVAYPQQNRALQQRVAENGAVVTEAPLGTPPTDRFFPRRNRLIAGLSVGVIVIEAAVASGTLITASVAQDMNRDIFAVPGSPLDPRCRGSNDLLRSGAHLTESAADVLAHLSPYPGRVAEGLAELPAAYDHAGDAASARQQILELLTFAPTPVDDLVRRCQLSAAAVAAVLSDLELANRVEMLPGHQVCLIMTDS